ncbi:MAG: hypothetical protein J7501_02720 [Bdellovibrio sp.]|nr:hypothetical protein [Bdellovibrio sp.]
MKLKSIIMMSALALMLGACASTAKKDSCGCGKDGAKHECSSTKECPMSKGSGCADCDKSSEKTGK